MTVERAKQWRGKRVLLTGHTGFKGSWLALWLRQWGADVHGFSLAPETPSLFQQAGLAQHVAGEVGDIREPGAIARAVATFRPDIVFHLAAQPLVRSSYQDPVGTYATNVLGTVHVLEAVRQTPGVKAVVCVTSDKCYENLEWQWGYRENDRLGGHDPYSSSKACAELVAAAYRASYFHLPESPLLATARAGNVIGGGDWAKDRLVPDAMRAFTAGETLRIRYPAAIRPWQHVLEAVNGYLVLGEALLSGQRSAAKAWNFGPPPQAFSRVDAVVERLAALWGAGAAWRAEPNPNWHEAGTLTLDITQAMRQLAWTPLLTLDEALRLTVAWYQISVHDDRCAFTMRQVAAYAEKSAGNG
jgi:CDP-glucose 4,6-dehydratase